MPVAVALVQVTSASNLNYCRQLAPTIPKSRDCEIRTNPKEEDKIMHWKAEEKKLVASVALLLVSLWLPMGGACFDSAMHK